ncbi:hypothetical protein C7T94_07200 [Pedobacter yulinensis]|uniref:LiaF transmembrane domain-containing protein n=1 Tax=Pedobacter yulinensis TaxID=2126353 RepID=A0A2T3HQ18_9SPHI|nr:DUF5668 domain-containing protein [Pedobacter yulinensis]PST84481.1 hypothetical protein C7T94_07200 [Pedobacter yulinensis]
MKTDKLIWGILLLFIGSVLLLENFGAIEFYWRNVWRFWPVFLIIAGLNVLFNRGNSKAGGIISLVVVVIVLGFVFVKGQEPPHTRGWWADNLKEDIEVELGDRKKSQLHFSEPYVAGSFRKSVLNIKGGGTSYKLNESTDQLVTADINRRSGNFSLQKQLGDSVQEVSLNMQDKKLKWNMNDGGNDVELRLNQQPEWDINVNVGAGEVDFDLSNHKVRAFNFNGGAAALDIKLGSLLPITDVTVKSGVADVKIKIPATAGCRIKAKTGLSAKDFTGFTKLDNGMYETPNYAGSATKIFINFDGGLSNFEVDRY